MESNYCMCCSVDFQGVDENVPGICDDCSVMWAGVIFDKHEKFPKKLYECCDCKKLVAYGFGEWDSIPTCLLSLSELDDRSDWGNHRCVPCSQKMS